MFIILCGLTKSLWARTANCAAGKRGSFSGREDDRSPLFSVEVQDQRSGAIPPFTNTPSCRSGMGGGVTLLYLAHYVVAILRGIPSKKL